MILVSGQKHQTLEDPFPGCETWKAVKLKSRWQDSVFSMIPVLYKNHFINIKSVECACVCNEKGFKR